MWREALLRWLLLWFVVSALPFALLRAASASPCVLPSVNPAALRAVATGWHRSKPQPAPRPWWASLAPSSLSVQLRDARQDGTGWYLSPTTGTSSQRGLVGATRGWSVGARWDLSRLFDTNQAAARGATAQTERVERLLSRVAVQVRALAKLRSQALDVAAETSQCRALRERAMAAALVVEGVSGSETATVVWPAMPPPQSQPGAAPQSVSSARSRAAPPARRPARLRRRGRGRQP